MHSVQGVYITPALQCTSTGLLGWLLLSCWTLVMVCSRVVVVAGTEWSPHPDTCTLVLQKVPSEGFVITEKAPTRAFPWLKAATTAFTFKTLLRHYAKRALTPRSLNVKLGPRQKGHKGQAVWLA